MRIPKLINPGNMKKLLFFLLSVLLFSCYVHKNVFSQGKCFFSQGVITGPQAVPMGTSGVIYSITPVGNATSLMWTVPDSWVITNGQGTTAITVTAGITFGNIMFYGYNECGVPVAQRALLVLATGIHVSVSISANPVGAVCSGTLVSFTALPVNGGSSPVFQWMVNGMNVGGNSSTYSYIPVDNDIVKCKLISNLPYAVNNPATSNSITMMVKPLLPVSVSVSPSSNPVCDGNAVTYIATPANGGSTPEYQWQVNGVNAGTNSASYSYSPSNNDAVTCVLTSNANCSTGSPAPSNTVTMTVNSIPASPTSGTNVLSGTQIIWNWNTVPGATGYKWNTTNDYSTRSNFFYIF